MRSFAASWTTASPIPLGRPAWHCSLSPAGRELRTTAWHSYSLVSQWPNRMAQTPSVFTDTGFCLPHYDPAGPALCPFLMLRFLSPTPLADFLGSWKDRKTEAWAHSGTQWERSGVAAGFFPTLSISPCLGFSSKGRLQNRKGSGS